MALSFPFFHIPYRAWMGLDLRASLQRALLSGMAFKAWESGWILDIVLAEKKCTHEAKIGITNEQCLHAVAQDYLLPCRWYTTQDSIPPLSCTRGLEMELTIQG